VITANGGQKLSTPEVDKVLQQYSDDELENTVLESATWKGEPILYVHLPTKTLAYMANSQTWIKLQTGLAGGRWTPIDIRYNPLTGQTECGDKATGVIGQFTAEIAQYGRIQEAYLQTPIVKVGKVSLFDLSLDTVSGFSDSTVVLSISATENGYTYSGEHTLPISTPKGYTTAPVLPRVGGVRDKIGFRLRMTTHSSINISGLTVRAENG
jgi:hypothetical protein